ncbi:zinc finger, CCHC-type, retrotransposon gag domain protein [Tanacetum coccineum]|uniref:Zinc finger, CCHC-type, retrotransposon gag domain protein n=1 Tax=Tanacetum coccineum TaxID=301880 RepID=A0ABQ5EX55_9ASTR
MEKIFDVMDCNDAFMTRLAVYKFEGDALAWWKAYKQAKGGDAWVLTLTWAAFKELFFLQFFPRAEQERLKREYHSIRQRASENSTEYMQRFLRLAGFLGQAAGTAEEQAKNFCWGLHKSILDHVMCIQFTDVAQVADAARNLEILRDRDDYDRSERSDKRHKSGDRYHSYSQQGSHKSHGQSDDRQRSDRQGSDRQGGGETQTVIQQAWDNFFKIKHAQSEEAQELLSKLLQDLQSINEELAEFINHPSWNLPTSSYDDDDDEYSFAQKYLMTCSTAVTPDSPVTDSLIMGDEHLDIIPETESDEFIKSSVEDLVPTPIESEELSDDQIDDEVFDSINSIPPGIDPFDAESDLLESMLNRDISIDSSPKIDSLLDEFAGELIFLDSIPPGIDKASFDPEKKIWIARIVKALGFVYSITRASNPQLHFGNPDILI